MSNSIFKVPTPYNEPVLSYSPNSKERISLQKAIEKQKNTYCEIPMKIGGKNIETADKRLIHPPHEHSHTLGHYYHGDASHVQMAIDAALAAKNDWENLAWEERCAIFLKAADLLSGPYRDKMNAATMLGQSKNVYQSEIDAVCEMADFFRFNVQFATEIYHQQPYSPPTLWNRLEYRPLEGFVFALTPFNFTSIAANLCVAPALMGNTIVWKPAETQIYSAQVIMDILEEAGLPDGVINLVFVDGPVAGDVIFKHPKFAGLHFTGSTGVFKHLWKTIGNNIDIYHSYPRIVGETGGKDFVVAHQSAPIQTVSTAISRGAFEFQGQKCSAASRAYLPKSQRKEYLRLLQEDVNSMKMGSPEDFSNFINAVIDGRAFDKISSYITNAKADEISIAAGGNFDKSEGFFIQPTILEVNDPFYTTMCEEIFGPILTVHFYDDNDFDGILKVVDQTSPYALTGALFAKDRYVLNSASKVLRNAAGNFYINDKPTGAVVGQQPFGGGRASGTNDKAGSILNLYRWLNPRTIKENFVPPIDYRYPFLG